jgi:hypothetical protein
MEEAVRYEIPEHRLEAFADLILASSKKARKLGVEGFKVERVAEHERILVTASDGEILTRQIVSVENGERMRTEWEARHPRTCRRRTFAPTKVVEVEVTGAEPVIEGWRFVASIDHDGSDRNLVNQVPGPDNPVTVSDWMHAGADCGHCKLNRNRLHTYVLEQRETGALLQVGSTCIADFLGGHTAEQMARLAELWVAIDLMAGSDRDEDWAPGERGEAGWLRSDVLAQTAAIVRRIGFVSKAAARDSEWKTPTAVLVVSEGLNWRPTSKEPVPPFPVEQEDIDLAALVASWVEDLEPRSSDDYLWNLQTAVGRPLTTMRTMGLVVSAVSAYRRELEWEARKAVEKAAAVPVPETDGRVEITGTVLSTKLVEGDYGTQLKMRLQVPHGDGAYTLWGTVPSAIDPEVGDTVSFTARVSRSRDDEAFGFWSRPTRAAIVAKEPA